MRPLPARAGRAQARPTDPTLERTIRMLIVIALITITAGVALLGALVAADSADGTAADAWMLNGPHSLH